MMLKKTGYIWHRGGAITGVALADVPEMVGERIEVPADLALSFLADKERMTAWLACADGKVRRVTDPSIFDEMPDAPLVPVSAADDGFPVRVVFRVGAATRRIGIAVEARESLSLGDVEADVRVIGTVEDQPVMERTFSVKDVANGGIEWEFEEGFPMEAIDLWMSATRGCGARRTEDGDEIPISAGELAEVLMTAERREPDGPCLLVERKRRNLVLTPHEGGGRRYAGTRLTIPLVLTAMGDPSLVLHGVDLDTAPLLEGTPITIKLPSGLAKKDFDVLLGRLFEKVVFTD